METIKSSFIPAWKSMAPLLLPTLIHVFSLPASTTSNVLHVDKIPLKPVRVCTQSQLSKPLTKNLYNMLVPMFIKTTPDSSCCFLLSHCLMFAPHPAVTVVPVETNLST